MLCEVRIVCLKSSANNANKVKCLQTKQRTGSWRAVANETDKYGIVELMLDVHMLRKLSEQEYL